LDLLGFRYIVGKNLILIASKPDSWIVSIQDNRGVLSAE
jgi:hypothetical protein